MENDCYSRQDIHSRGTHGKKDTIGDMKNRVPNCGQEKWFRYLNVYNFDGIANFRDCAGTDPAKVVECFGGTVKRGMLFRSAHLTCATQDDIRRLKDDFKIKTYIDLRVGRFYFNANLEGVDCDAFDIYSPSPCLIREEHQSDGGFVAKKPGECRRVWINLNEGLQPVDQSRTLTSEDHLGYTCVRTLLDEKPRQCILEIFELLADEVNYPMMFGCTGGKDRTGVTDLLVKKLLGVDDAIVIEEYLITNLCNGHHALNWWLAPGAFFKKLKDTYQNDDAIKAALKRLFHKEHPEPWSDEFKKGARSLCGTDDPDSVAEAAAAHEFQKLSAAPTIGTEVMSSLNDAPFLDAQDFSAYISVVRKVLKQLEELGGIEKFLDDIGFPSEKQDCIKRILVRTM